MSLNFLAMIVSALDVNTTRCNIVCCLNYLKFPFSGKLVLRYIKLLFNFVNSINNCLLWESIFFLHKESKVGIPSYNLFINHDEWGRPSSPWDSDTGWDEAHSQAEWCLTYKKNSCLGNVEHNRIIGLACGMLKLNFQSKNVKLFYINLIKWIVKN